MTEHLDDDTLDAYVGGTLPERERAAVGAHLASCATCRGAEASLRAFLARVASLPRERQPERDLWTDIRETIHAEPRSAGRDVRVAPRPSWRTAAGLIAAAVVVAAVSSIITVKVVQTGASGHSAAVQAGDVAYERVAARYDPAIAALRAELDAHRSALSPATVAAVERNLAIIDAAIGEARAALARDPHNAAIAAVLSASLQRKVTLLQRAAALGSGT